MPPTHDHPVRIAPGLLLASLLALLPPRSARAEDAITYKYQGWHEDHGRIQVEAHYGLFETDLTPETRIKVMGLIDAISGATPTGEIAAPGAPVPTTEIEDLRRAWDLNVAHQFPRVNLSASFGVSREDDYVSRGWSLNSVTDFNQKNTNVLFGYAHTDDRIHPSFWRADREKFGDDLILGVTQLLDPVTQLTANITFGRAQGFLADPYKFVSKTILFDPGVPGFPPIPIPSTVKENRPDERQKAILYLGLNHRFERLDAALDASYRLYHDDFGITSHTVSAEWFQQIGPAVVLRPGVRYYRQTAADFYYYDLDKTSIVPVTDDTSPVGPGNVGTGRAPYYTSDYRLAEMETLSYGVKAVWTIRPWLAADLTLERYLSHGLDGATPQETFPDANVITLGLRLNR